MATMIHRMMLAAGPEDFQILMSGRSARLGNGLRTIAVRGLPEVLQTVHSEVSGHVAVPLLLHQLLLADACPLAVFLETTAAVAQHPHLWPVTLELPAATLLPLEVVIVVLRRAGEPQQVPCHCLELTVRIWTATTEVAMFHGAAAVLTHQWIR